MANTYKALQTVTVGAGGVASVSFTNIPQTYTDLVIKTSYRSTRNAAGDTLRIVFSNGTTYNQIVAYGNGSTVANFTGSSSSGIEGLWGSDDSNTANVFGNSEMYIPNYALSNVKRVSEASATENNAVTAFVAWGAGVSNSTSPITSITLTSNTSSTIKQYSTFTLYGVFNADVSSAPATPTIGTATKTGPSTATVAFTGVSNAASYTATSTPGSITATGTTSPLTVLGLTPATSYTFKVKSNNPFGSSAESAASNSITTDSSAFESIATVDVGSGGSSTVTFSSIPATFSHLQIRLLARSGRAVGSSAGLYLQLNSNFLTAAHQLRGNGSTASAGNSVGGLNNGTLLVCVPGTSASANIFGAGIIDILDYANTNKNKTVRILSGDDLNGDGASQINSGFWNSTSAITSITFGSVDGVGNIPQYSHFALYGIRST